MIAERSPVSGTEGYAEQAPILIEKWCRLRFCDIHRSIRHLFPPGPARPGPARILDIGAGIGTDAAAFAGMGHRVVAVEPTALAESAGFALQLRLEEASIQQSNKDAGVT